MKPDSVSEWIYAQMLYAYSPAFRRRFGQQAQIVFSDCLHDAEASGPHAIILFWIGTVADLLVSAINERSDSLGGITMNALMPLFQGLLVLICVFGAYIIFGGDIKVVTEALPDEVMTIVFGGLAAHWIAKGAGRPNAIRSLLIALSGRRFRDTDFNDLITLLCNDLQKIPARIEGHIRICADLDMHLLLGDAEFLARHALDKEQVNAALDARVSAITNERKHVVESLERFSSILLAFGAIAVIMGLIKTCSHIPAPIDEIGDMLGSTMIGALLSIFLTRAFVTPAAGRLSSAIEDDRVFYAAFAKGLAGQLTGLAPSVAARCAAVIIPARLLNHPAMALMVQPEAG